MAKEFKRSSSKNFKGKKASDTKKSRPDKGDKKPSFERFRDESRPSDFGSPKKRNSYGSDNFRKKREGENDSYTRKPDDRDEKSSYKDRDDKKSFDRKPFSDKPPFKKKWDDTKKTSFRKRDDDRAFDSGEEKKSFSDKPTFKKKWGDDKPKTFGKRPFSDKPDNFKKEKTTANPYDMDESDLEYGKSKPAYNSNSGRDFKKKPYVKKTFSKNKPASKPQRTEDDGMMRLNKYLSNAGICSRREADDLIASGVVQVNGKTITEMGFRVKQTDIIKYGGQTLKKERMVYLILNKPKDYITTFDDPQKRKTVLELVQGACKERIYPVGRLDRATTGLLMFTNDGDLTKKLTHPRYGVRKIYHVELDKPLKRQDLDQIAEGIELEDGPIKVDEVTYVGDGADKTMVGVEIHSGKNRIVRRIFEHMSYNVRKLDRVMFGSLTKKDLPRGRWRFLTEAEVGMLKMISAE